MPTLTEASNDVQQVFWDDWRTIGRASELSVGVYVPVHWPNTDAADPTDTSVEWVGVDEVALGSGNHSGIGDGTGRYLKLGMVIFRIFTVKGEGNARYQALSEQIQNIYDGKTSPACVRFRETSADVVGSEGQGWHQVNVTVFYEYEEFK